MEMDKMTDDMASPSNSQKTVSDDDEIDYSVKPHFYTKKSNLVPFTQLLYLFHSLNPFVHEIYVTHYRAIFVENCKILSDQIVHQKEARPRKGKRGRESSEHEATPTGNQAVKQVCCLVCSTEVGVIDADEVYHFFNVLPSES
ncbi:unnamed protein product [Malus baccata var. baccata]